MYLVQSQLLFLYHPFYENTRSKHFHFLAQDTDKNMHMDLHEHVCEPDTAGKGKERVILTRMFF